ncbi:hypothetical protein [Nocardioides marmoraquaticus]
MDAETGRTALTWLPRLAVVETLTVLVLLGNRATAQVDGVASLVGPVHGLAYLVTIACAWLAPIPKRARWAAVLPVVGGLLALAQIRRSPRPADGAAHR